MGQPVKFTDGTEAQILALTPENPKWIDKGFYYPSDKSYFYRVLSGQMVKYGAGDISVVGTGCTINDKVIGGVKRKILSGDVLNIPEDFDYNTFNLDNFGVINQSGIINIM